MDLWSCFVPSQWREIWKNGSTAPNFQHLDKLHVCRRENHDKIHTLPHSALWSGVPDVISELFLQPGEEVNSQSHDLSHDQDICFTQSSETSQEDLQCDSCILMTDSIESEEICRTTNNESIIPHKIVLLEENSSLQTRKCVARDVDRSYTPNDVSSSDTAGILRTKSPVLICDSETEECVLRKKDLLLPGLSTIYQKLSHLHVQSSSIDPIPPSPVSHIVPAECGVKSPSFSCLSGVSKTIVSTNKRHGVVDLTQDDDVILVEDVRCKRENRSDKALRATSNNIPVATCCGILLTQADLNTLRPNCWLNDQVINAFMKLLMRFYNTPQQGSTLIHIVSTFFYNKLRSTGYAGVERWLKKVDMNTLQLLLVPVHLGSHWCLAAINFREKSISYFDSLGGRNLACLKRLKLFLIQSALKGKTRTVKYWRLYHPQGVPQQDNGSDCGVFVCQFARWLCCTGIKTRTNSHSNFPFSHEHMPQFRTLMIEQLKHETLYPNIYK